MEYKLIEKDGGLIVKGLKDFNTTHIFENGQSFRWYKEEDGSYTVVAGGKVANFLQRDDLLYADRVNKLDWEKFWHNYFDLDRDYGEIKRILSKDPVMEEAIRHGEGIRLLRQDPYETVISFIISANNQIPRIKKAVETISTDLGEYICSYKGREYHSFPEPVKLANKTPEYIKEVYRVGFRAERLKEVSRRVAYGEFDLNLVNDADLGEARQMLMTLPGVGPKVSDCILLFAYSKGRAFPVDVWVKRIMEHLYLGKDAKKKTLEGSGDELFGDLAGYAQQYLFYYARENGIGK